MLHNKSSGNHTTGKENTKHLTTSLWDFGKNSSLWSICKTLLVSVIYQRKHLVIGIIWIHSHKKRVNLQYFHTEYACTAWNKNKNSWNNKKELMITKHWATTGIKPSNSLQSIYVKKGYSHQQERAMRMRTTPNMFTILSPLPGPISARIDTYEIFIQWKNDGGSIFTTTPFYRWRNWAQKDD